MQSTAKCITCGLTLIVALQIAVPVGASRSGARLLRPDRTASFTATATVASGNPAPHIRPRIREFRRCCGMPSRNPNRFAISSPRWISSIGSSTSKEGTCRNPEHRSCLHLVADSPNIIVHIDPRQQIRSVVAQLAHELYHAAEIGREPDVVDAAGLLALYTRVGELFVGRVLGNACRR